MMQSGLYFLKLAVYVLGMLIAFLLPFLIAAYAIVPFFIARESVQERQIFTMGLGAILIALANSAFGLARISDSDEDRSKVLRYAGERLLHAAVLLASAAGLVYLVTSIAGWIAQFMNPLVGFPLIIILQIMIVATVVLGLWSTVDGLTELNLVLCARAHPRLAAKLKDHVRKRPDKFSPQPRFHKDARSLPFPDES